MKNILPFMAILTLFAMLSMAGCFNDAPQSTVKIILPVDAGMMYAADQPGATAGGAGLAVRVADAYVSYLVDAEGRSVYAFSADEGGESICVDACAAEWPPVMTHGKPKALQPAVERMKVGTVEREDGSQQVTYHRQPLYYFVNDAEPGQTRGHGVENHGGTWYLVTPQGEAVDYD